jgi:hypothetical protein
MERSKCAVLLDDTDVPLEFEGKVASTRAVAEAGDIECSATTARHCSWTRCVCGGVSR